MTFGTGFNARMFVGPVAVWRQAGTSSIRLECAGMVSPEWRRERA
jgi:hypothetical protein